jgi:hypothetical protein
MRGIVNSEGHAKVTPRHVAAHGQRGATLHLSDRLIADCMMYKERVCLSEA